MRTVGLVALSLLLGACDLAIEHTGRVVDPVGAPLAGARVTLHSEAFSTRPLIAETTTGADGRFTIRYSKRRATGDDPPDVDNTLTVRRAEAAESAFTTVLHLSDWSADLGTLPMLVHAPTVTIDDTAAVITASTSLVAVDEGLMWDVVAGSAVMPVEALRTTSAHTFRAASRQTIAVGELSVRAFSPSVTATAVVPPTRTLSDGHGLTNGRYESILLYDHVSIDVPDPQPARQLFLVGWEPRSGQGLPLVEGPVDCTPHDTTIVCAFGGEERAAIVVAVAGGGHFYLAEAFLF